MKNTRVTGFLILLFGCLGLSGCGKETEAEQALEIPYVEIHNDAGKTAEEQAESGNAQGQAAAEKQAESGNAQGQAAAEEQAESGNAQGQAAAEEQAESGNAQGQAAAEEQAESGNTQEQEAAEINNDSREKSENAPSFGEEIVTVTLSAVGDVSLGNYLTQGYDWSFDQTYELEQDTAYYLKNVHDIFAADDMTIVNLEGPLTDRTEVRIEKEFEIKGKPEYVKILTDGDVEVATIANNHILDFKEEGRQDTIELLEQEGILYAYDEKLTIYETKGIKIGVVAVSNLSQSAYSEANLQNGIASLKEQWAEIILACCHWGIERENYPDGYQVKLGRQCIDWGADIVLGCHPHVLQSIEQYQGKFIVYSMGNFCFGANRNPADKDSMIFQPTFTFVDGVKQDEISVKVIPCSISSVSSRNNYQPTPAQGDEAIRIIDRINEFSKDYQVHFDYDGNLTE